MVDRLLECVFQSTLSVRRATQIKTTQTPHKPLFQSTLSVRRATSGDGAVTTSRLISIHALRKESDLDYLIA